MCWDGAMHREVRGIRGMQQLESYTEKNDQILTMTLFLFWKALTSDTITISSPTDTRPAVNLLPRALRRVSQVVRVELDSGLVSIEAES